ncbi:NmrA family NAD(P)-binding protein [Cryptosporangium minutisporangium]|uniref:NmrA family NAD(P)-binding protein n=1 Tax=Cryptosporangium minutisporangium TaxID=113569 RepID=A0ABP6SPY0_9ACTN
MYAITGVTGHVGGATARALLATAAAVRVVVRDQEKGRAWAERGADVAVADFTDRTALAAAFVGCRGAFVMLPTIPTATDADHRHLADTIAGAVADSGVPHVVMLSSVGAELPEGTGPIRWLHHLESRLRETDAVLTALRSPHFQEKVEAVLGAATGVGVYPVFGDSPDVPTPMVATRDIGATVARLLTSPPSASEVVDLAAPSYTERQVADALGAALGAPLQVVPIRRSDWLGALTDAGVPPLLADELVALYDAEDRGVLRPCGDRQLRCTTTLDETLRHVVQAAARG